MPVVGTGKTRYVETLGNGASGPVTSISLGIARIHTLTRHAHKHVAGGTGIVLNTESDPYGSEGSGGGSERSQLSGRKWDRYLREIANSRLSRRLRDRGTDKPSGNGDDVGDGDHF